MKPPFAYYGGKTRIAPWIVSLMPEHRVYVEPCLGAGSVFFAKTVTEHEILNDLNRSIVAFFTMLRDRTDELVALCEATPYARAELASSQPEPDLDDLELARRWWATVNQSFNKTGRHDNGFSASVRAGAGEAKSTKRRLLRLRAVADRLQDAVIECRPAIEVVATYDTPETLHYVDPPYVRAARTNTSSAYLVEMTDEDQHDLVKALSECKGTVMVSGYESDLYAELFGGWHTTSISIVKHSGNRHSEERGRATEVIWSNRPLVANGQIDFGGAA